jgi:hypothetical protein
MTNWRLIRRTLLLPSPPQLQNSWSVICLPQKSGEFSPSGESTSLCWEIVLLRRFLLAFLFFDDAAQKGARFF